MMGRFLSIIGKIDSKLALIRDYCVESHMERSPENVNWASVGSSKHVLELLDEILEFLNIKEGEER
jgi:hypothetical protein